MRICLEPFAYFTGWNTQVLRHVCYFLLCVHWISPQKLWRRRCHPIHKRTSNQKFEVLKIWGVNLKTGNFWCLTNRNDIFFLRMFGGLQLRSANLAARRAREIRAMCQGEVGDGPRGMWVLAHFCLSCTKIGWSFVSRKQVEGLLVGYFSKSPQKIEVICLEHQLKLHLLGVRNSW